MTRENRVLNESLDFNKPIPKKTTPAEKIYVITENNSAHELLNARNWLWAIIVNARDQRRVRDARFDSRDKDLPVSESGKLPNFSTEKAFFGRCGRNSRVICHAFISIFAARDVRIENIAQAFLMAKASINVPSPAVDPISGINSQTYVRSFSPFPLGQSFAAIGRSPFSPEISEKGTSFGRMSEDGSEVSGQRVVRILEPTSVLGFRSLGLPKSREWCEMRYLGKGIRWNRVPCSRCWRPSKQFTHQSQIIRARTVTRSRNATWLGRKAKLDRGPVECSGSRLELTRGDLGTAKISLLGGGLGQEMKVRSASSLAAAEDVHWAFLRRTRFEAPPLEAFPPSSGICNRYLWPNGGSAMGISIFLPLWCIGLIALSAIHWTSVVEGLRGWDFLENIVSWWFGLGTFRKLVLRGFRDWGHSNGCWKI